jgi:hypothetical protein
MVRAYLEFFPYTGSLLLMIVTVIGGAIPTPGGVGGFQYFMNLGLVYFFPDYLSSRDPYSTAAGISNGTYFASMLPVWIIGLVLMNQEGLSWTRIPQTNQLKDVG